MLNIRTGPQPTGSRNGSPLAPSRRIPRQRFVPGKQIVPSQACEFPACCQCVLLALYADNTVIDDEQRLQSDNSNGMQYPQTATVFRCFTMLPDPWPIIEQVTGRDSSMADLKGP